MSSTALVIHESEIPQFGADPYAEMVAADKARKRRLAVLAWEAEQERLRIDREARRHQEICRNVLQADKLIEAARRGRPRRMRVPRSGAAPDYGPRVIGPMTDSDEARRFVHIIAGVRHTAYRQIIFGSREAQFAKSRQIAMFLIYKKLGWGLSRIGRFFRKDHTTALHAIRKVSALISQGHDIATEVALIEAEIARDAEERRLRQRVVEKTAPETVA